MYCSAVAPWHESSFDPQAMNPIIRKVGEGCINGRKGIGRRIFQQVCIYLKGQNDRCVSGKILHTLYWCAA